MQPRLKCSTKIGEDRLGQLTRRQLAKRGKTISIHFVLHLNKNFKSPTTGRAANQSANKKSLYHLPSACLQHGATLHTLLQVELFCNDTQLLMMFKLVGRPKSDIKKIRTHSTDRQDMTQLLIYYYNFMKLFPNSEVLAKKMQRH